MMESGYTGRELCLCRWGHNLLGDGGAGRHRPLGQSREAAQNTEIESLITTAVRGQWTFVRERATHYRSAVRRLLSAPAKATPVPSR